MAQARKHPVVRLRDAVEKDFNVADACKGIS